MPPQLIFINGPTISSSVSSEERRLIRSQIASRHRNALPVPASGQPIPALDDTKARVSATTSYNDADDGDIQDVHINGDVNESERDLQIWSPVSGVQFEPSPTTGVAFFDRQTRDAIDYRLRVILPDFRQLGQYAEKYFRTFVLEAKNKPLAISATVLNALVHKSTTRLVNREQHTTEIRDARYKVIQLVRQAIAEDYRLPDLLSAILILATTEPTPVGPSRKEFNPFTPPSLGSQWLEVYIRKPISQVHWQAIETLISIHGGIHQLKTYGSAWQIALTGLMKSALTVTRPPYPLISPEGHEYPDISTLQYLGIQNAPAGVSALGGFFLLKSQNIKSSVIKRFVELREFVWVVENLQPFQSQQQAFHRDSLMDCRNLIQHRLLSLPDAAGDSISLFAASEADTGEARAIYGACLATTLLLSIHVILPLPAPSGPRVLLLERLIVALSSVDITEELLLPGWSQMSLWCSFIGGIAALGSSSRGYFVAKIKDTALACGLESWEEVRVELERFIWLGLSCDARAVELWREACSLLDDGEGDIVEMVLG